VSSKQLTISLRGEAQPGKLLHRIVKRQQPGTPFGHRLLPDSSFLVLANLSNAEAQAESKKTWGPVLRALFKSAEGSERDKKLEAAVLGLAARLTGDATAAVHRPQGEAGVAISVVARVKEAEQARKAMEELADVVAAWASEQQTRAGSDRSDGRGSSAPLSPPLKGERRDLAHKGAKGSVVELTVPWPEDRREAARKLFGERVGLGWAFAGEHALFYLGKNAARQLELLAAGAASGKIDASLGDSAAFKRALGASPARVGMVYLSLVDFVRWFEGTGIEDGEKMAASLKGKRVASALSLDWGVNALRTQFDVSLHLPADHFLAFKPIVAELLRGRRGGLLVPPAMSQPASAPAERSED
jgi:hypothetical protein